MPNKIVGKRHMRRKVAERVKNALHEIECEKHSSAFSMPQNVPDNPRFNKITQLTLNNAASLNTTASSFSVNYTVPKPNITEETALIPNKLCSNSNTISERNNSLSNAAINGSAFAEKEAEFEVQLKHWSLRNNITHKALNELINILKPFYKCHHNSARSLLHTPRKCKATKLDNGEMIYFGIENGIKKNVRYKLEKSDLIELQINVDGIPIYNKSNIEFWPILGCIQTSKEKRFPFVIAVFCGRGKPRPLNTYLGDFINEAKVLLENGVIVSNKTYKLVLTCFSCDAPARSFLKVTKGHTSTFACERCTIKSLYIERRRFFPVENKFSSRISSDFVGNSSEGAKSPLLELNIDLVKQFVLDPMHLIYLGALRRLMLKYWLEGKRPSKLSKIQIATVDAHIKSTKNPILDFGHSLRPISEMKRWKATEFRFFLLYCGPIVLKKVLSREKYKHFLLLHIAVTIMSSEPLIEKYLDVAKIAMDDYVSQSSVLYDKYYISYNVHSLIHVHEDVVKYGPLETYSCFPFENMLGKLKRCIRGTKHPLAQIKNRLLEFDGINYFNRICDEETTRYKPIYIFDKIDEVNFKCKHLQIRDFTISIVFPNNIASIERNIYIIKSIICQKGSFKCICVRPKQKDSLYVQPINSAKLGIFFVKSIPQSPLYEFKINDISYRYISYVYREGYVVIPVNHQKN